MALIKNAQADSMPRRAMVLDLGDLARQAESMAASARQRSDAILSAAAKERDKLISGAAEEGRTKGHAEGLAKGLIEGREKGQKEALAQGKTSIEAMTKAWTESLGRFESERDAMLSNARVDVLRLASTIARRVTKRVVELNPDLVKDQLQAVLLLVSAPTKLRIRVHPSDLETARQCAPALLDRLSGGAHAEIAGDESMARGSCVILTERGELDASIDAQIDRIVDALLPGERAETLNQPQPPAGGEA